jgi:hypothetical protein
MRQLVERLLARRGLKLVRVGTGVDSLGVADPFRAADFSPAWRETVQAAQPLTLTSPERIAAVIAAVEHVVAGDIGGVFVECGVWQGGSSLAAALTFQRLGQPRDLYLFDTFSGMPAPGEADVDMHGVHARSWWSEARQRQAAAEHGATADQVRATMLATGYPPERVHLVEGLVEQTLPTRAPDRIAILRLDTDFYASTRHELAMLWPLLAPGGILIVDDYGHFEGARRAVDEFLADVAPRPFLHRIDYTGRLIVKPS